MNSIAAAERPASATSDVGSWGTEVWLGSVNSWQCDRMGHLNTRFYVGHVWEGITVLAALLGLTRAFAPDAPTTLQVHTQEIRFLKEARLGAALTLRAGVLDFGEEDASIGTLLLHGDGSIAGSAITRVSPVSGADGSPVSWPSSTRERAAALTVIMPEPVRPRGVTPFSPPGGLSLETAQVLGLQRVGIGVFGPDACDVFGRMRIDQLITRVSDGIGRLIDPINDLVGAAASVSVPRPGGAVLEYRSAHHAWPRAGDLFEVRSGLVGVEGKVLRLVHWMLDPVSDRIWATLDGVSVTLDLDRRRAVEISAKARQLLDARCVRAISC